MPTDAHPGLGRWPLTLQLPVQWGDMDAFAHVNNTVYLRWFETGRIAYFEKTGVAKNPDGAGPMPLLARSEVDYLAPVTYPDTVTVKTTVLKTGNTSFVMGYQVFSAKLGTLVARGEGVIVMVDGAGKKTPLPQALRDAITATEASAQG
jgi:acyl-CoA thioester hydrolase